MTDHFRRLERMYLAAPNNQLYDGLTIEISDSAAEIGFTVAPELCHAGGAMHGCHYFKLLDDAAYFAVNSVVPDTFVLTVQFSIQLMRPVVGGRVVATGHITKPGRNTFFAESEQRDAAGKLVAKGHGTFNLSGVQLADVPGYIHP